MTHKTADSMWECNDDEEDYVSGISSSFADVLGETIDDFMGIGVDVGGAILGMPGAVVGGIVCGIVGGVVGVFKGIFR